tara:strand:+ start:1451 stop:1777 length:327 start_codon:yes stop_codon:yes gene_type:complete
MPNIDHIDDIYAEITKDKSNRYNDMQADLARHEKRLRENRIKNLEPSENPHAMRENARIALGKVIAYGGKTRRRSSARKHNKSKKHHKKSKKHHKKHHNKKSKKHRKK